ncbi:MAG: protein kinase [Bacteroidota bacterium]
MFGFRFDNGIPKSGTAGTQWKREAWTMIDQTISHYKILEKLGEGGMGVVYKAEDTNLKRIVALKFLPHHLTTNDAEGARFIQEAQAVAALNHPNICAIYSFGEHEGTHFIEMELVEGVTLRHKLPIQKQADAVSYAIQIGEALQEAHSKGIVHRDVKAENIMTNTKNQIKVMDFGLAKLKGSLKLTKKSSRIGTLAYMAPEQIQGGEVDARSDLFSFGIVVFEMLTGRTPFRGEHEAATIYSIVNEPPESLLKLRPDVSPELERIVHRAVEKDPEDRYQSAADMVSELRRVQKQSTKVSRTMEKGIAPALTSETRLGAAAASDVATSPNRTRQFMIAGIVLAVIAAVIVGYLLFSTKRQTIDSLAVLPFVNVSTDPEKEYLTEGVTENITNKLSQFSGLRVIPRSLVARYKGADVDPRAAGADLKVGAVLTGRIIQRGDSLDIQTELIDVHNVSQIWGEHYNRPSSDLVEIQDDIIKNISGKIKGEASAEENNRLIHSRAVDPEAYKLYLQGMYFWNKRSAEGNRKAIEYFENAVGKDPTYALAYIGIADAYILAAVLSSHPADFRERIKAAALKGLELDSALPEAHAALGDELAYFEFDLKGAERELRRAITLNPNYATGHHWLGEFLVAVGKYDEGLAEYRRAMELDPVSLAISSDYAYGLYFAQQFDRSIEELKKIIETDPNFVRAHFYITLPYLMKGMPKAAFDEFIKGMVAEGDSAATIAAIQHAFAVSGYNGVVKLQLELADTLPIATAIFDAARCYAFLGDKNSALATLEKEYEERQYSALGILVEPMFHNLRKEPRFIALFNKLENNK